MRTTTATITHLSCRYHIADTASVSEPICTATASWREKMRARVTVPYTGDRRGHGFGSA
jgi:hypothetical protein